MNDFLLVFRTDTETMDKLSQRSPEELAANDKLWMAWIGGIAAQNKLVDKGNRLFTKGKVVKGKKKLVSNGPYAEIKECVLGFTIVRAETLDEATEMAKGCPILGVGGSVEVRQINN